jgi:hypothetical protein
MKSRTEDMAQPGPAPVAPRLRCPSCTRPLEGRACRACAVEHPGDDELVDLRRDRAPVEPRPLRAGALERFFAATAAGAGHRAAFEQLLLSLDDLDNQRLMQLVREARGAWHPLLHELRGAALFLGNAFSGTITALANNGFHVTVLDSCPERVRFAVRRAAENSPGRVRGVVAGDAARLPFDDASFALVVQEDGLPGANGIHAHRIDEALRVAAEECVLTADNRLAYKKNLGRRGEFVRLSPTAWLASAVRPRRGERLLPAYRRSMAKAGWDAPEAWALYPHSFDWSHAVALDADRPCLTIGPNERRNKLKLLGHALGLFPWFAPSFAVHARRSAARPRRIDRILDALARATGEPRPQVETLVATRGQSAVIHTSVPGLGAEDPRGRWTLHLPLCPKNEPQLELHVRSLHHARERFPRLPVPEPLHGGRIEGLWLSCERRLPHHAMPQYGRDRAAIERACFEAALHLAGLVARRVERYDDAEHARLVRRPSAIVARHAAVDSTRRWLAEAEARAFDWLRDRPLPLVLYHGDLRGKHVQTTPEGRVLGFLDWGTTEFEGLPLFDLLHLLVHERKQHGGRSAADCWRAIQDPARREPHEARAIAAYNAAIGLHADAERALCLLYPMLVAATAEQHWDYSRPRWLHSQFDV